MKIFVVITAWTLGSILLGLLLGRIFRQSAKRRRAEERFIVWLQAKTSNADHSCARRREREVSL